MKRQKVDDRCGARMAPAIHLDWLPGVAYMTFSKFERDYRLYLGIADDNSGQPTDVPPVWCMILMRFSRRR